MRRRITLQQTAAVLVLALTLTGCPASTQPVDATTAAFRTIGSVKLTVDTAMRLWSAHVVRAGRCPYAKTAEPCVPADQEKEVREAFLKYQATARALGAVLVATNEAPTPEQLSNAAASIVGLIQYLTGKEVVVPKGGAK